MTSAPGGRAAGASAGSSSPPSSSSGRAAAGRSSVAVAAREPELLPTATPARTRAELVRRLRRAPLRPVLALLITVAGVVAGLFVPRALGTVVDLAAEGGHRTGALTGPVLLVAGACLVQAVLTGWGDALVARTGEELLAEVRESALGRALAIPAERLERSGTGDLVSRVSNDVAVLADAVRSLVPQLAGAVLQIGLTFVALLVLDWRFALVSLLVVPLQLAAVRWLRRTARPVRTAERAALGSQAQAILESTDGAHTVRAFRLERHRLELIRERSRRTRDLALRSTRIGTRFFGKLNGAEWLGLSALLVTGWLLVRSGDAALGTASAAALYFHRLFDPINQLLSSFDEVQSAGAAANRVVGLAQTETETETDADAGARADTGGGGPNGAAASSPPSRLPSQRSADGRPAGRATLEVLGVAHSYTPGTPVLSGIGLRLAPGERVAVVGTTGAGKSTLARLVAGVQRPSAGTVLLGGRPVQQLSAGELSAAVALVSQETHVFAGPLRDDLLLARPGAADDELWRALAEVGADAWARTLPDGLDTPVGQGGGKLDALRAQHLALARLVLADPAVAVLDEATAEAGSAGARVLEKAAERALAGRTALVVAHRLSQAARADRVVVLSAGRIAEEGAHAELVAAGGEYAALWAAWSGARG